MFDSLSDKLNTTLRAISGKGRITEDNIKDTLREVRMALLEADVALPVVKEFVEQVKNKAVGQEVSKSLNPGQAFIRIVNDQLVQAMGQANDALDLKTTPPAVILMAGLQGAGKTTSVAKLARYLKEREKKKVMVTSADVYRPAAIKQLERLAEEVSAEFYPSDPSQDPVTIAKDAIDAARKQFADVVIIDTAGRLAIDQEMMGELSRIHQAVNPIETLFVVDAMTGQDAANTARAFHQQLTLTGVILTKADGDARGGAALSIRQITGKPIKFIGMGEKIDALEPFHPDRIASQILGMGDVLSLIEDVERKVDKGKAQRLARKISTGKAFDLEDFKEQLVQMKSMGGLSSLMGKLPGMGAIPEAAKNQINDKSTMYMEAMINSMTPQERQFPKLIKGSRKKRIALGSGTSIQEVNKLLKQFTQMQRMMRKMSGKGGMKKMMRSMQGMMPPGGGGGMPPFR
ncbi:MAG: signal recognition particle protein [Gammaproteobacteria bacterium]|nr:signal recognition particle protein [Gammaproteobacteria bacterium]